MWLWDSSRLISFSMFSSPSNVLNLFGIYVICSLLTVDVLPFLYVFLNPSQLHYILFSYIWWASLYHYYNERIWVFCICLLPFLCTSYQLCKTNLHFQNSAYILHYDGRRPFLFLSATASWQLKHWKIDLLCLTFRKLNDLCYCLFSSVFIWLHAQWTFSWFNPQNPMNTRPSFTHKSVHLFHAI